MVIKLYKNEIYFLFYLMYVFLISVVHLCLVMFKVFEKLEFFLMLFDIKHVQDANSGIVHRF